MRPRPLLLLGSLLAIIVLAGGGYFYAQRGERRPAPTTPVILISIDTLRAGELGCYGYELKTTPAIDRFAQDAILFEDAFAPEPQTLPSHVTLLTGLLPTSHGVFPPMPTTSAAAPHEVRALSPNILTLAELLAPVGYRAGAFVNIGFLDQRTGLARKFVTYDCFPVSPVNVNPKNRASRHGRSAEETNVAALAWLDQLGPDPSRFFLFLHYFDVHSDVDHLPYDSPPEYRERFTSWYHGSFASDASQSYASDWCGKLNESGTELPEEDRRYIRGLYDAGVAYTDDQVGALFTALKDRGIYDRALIVLVADHGEEFQEHGKLMHTQLYDECLHVPMLVKLPRGAHAGTRVPGLVSLADVLPTVVGYLGLEAPPYVQGQDRMPLVHGGGAPAEVLTLSYCLNGALGLRTARYKLLTHEKYRQALFLYDLAKDPLEKTSIAQTDAARAKTLQELLFDLHSRMPDLSDEHTFQTWTPEKLREFQGLGYLKGK